MKKIIIGIHGIGNKPPINILRKWWLNSIYEGLKKYNYSPPDLDFEMVYWADILHKSPLNPEETDKNKPCYMAEKYVPEEFTSIKKPAGFRQKAIEYLEKYYDKLMVNGVLSLENKTITELFIHMHMKDLESYYAPVYLENSGKKIHARDAILDRLTNKLREHKDKTILLIAHSMGSIISQDVLIERLPDIKIDTLITIGSPLGQKYVIDNYSDEQKQKSINKLRVPDNIINHWYNLADFEDQVAINHALSKYYEKSSKNLAIDDKMVRNNFVYQGISNPHKSFGYLRTPEVAEIIDSFLASKYANIYARIKKKLGKILQINELDFFRVK
ncbi:MAG TPA: hypothetical protein VJ954_09125 [Ignavibacteriaceae bacterium]|nr:hypothetical protein [Ignavibacteriaceae bacterium]